MPDLMDCYQIHASVRSFATSLYSQVLGEAATVNLRNQFFSPFSLYAALSLVLAGSANETRSELLRIMHVTSIVDDKVLNEAIGTTLNDVLHSNDGIIVSLANGLFADHTAPLKESYKKMLIGLYKATTENVDFQNDAETVRKHINKWVNDQVHGKILELLSENSVSRETRMMLVNTLYFKGKWAEPFQKSATEEGDFFFLDGMSKKVPLMYQEKNLDWSNLPNLDAQLLKLVFNRREPQWRMAIILPNKRDGLITLLKELKNPDKWSSLLETKGTLELVRIWLPRFKLCTDEMWDTKQTLLNLGLSTLFVPEKANLSGISEEKLFVSDVKHKAILEVNEEGAMATAATAVSVANSCWLPAATERKQFRVDHPFLVLLLDQHGTPMFMGHVVEPQEL